MIYHYNAKAPALLDAVLERLLKLGYTYASNCTSLEQIKIIYPNYQNWSFLEIKVTSKTITPYSEKHNPDNVTIEQLFTDSFMMPPKSITVNLNSDYNAIVTKSGVIVGCTTFNLDVIDKLVSARDSLGL